MRSSRHRRKHHCGVREMSQWYRAHVVLAGDPSQVRSTHYPFLRCREKMMTEEARIAQDFTLPFPTKPFPPRRDESSLSVLYLSLVCLCKPPLGSSFLYLLPYSCFPTETSQQPSFMSPLQRSERAAGITPLWLHCCLSFCLLTSWLGFRSHTNNRRELKEVPPLPVLLGSFIVFYYYHHFKHQGSPDVESLKPSVQKI